MAEPKSGKLFKLSTGLFGARWSEKWAHWDGRVLKLFPLASAPQSSFSWSSGRPGGCAFDLTDCVLAPADEKKLNRKHAFHLIPNDRTDRKMEGQAAKPGTFACVSEHDLAEWRAALTRGAGVAVLEREASSIVAEKIRRVAEVFSSLDVRRTDKLETSKLRVLLREGEDSELALIQQQLDPTQQGKVSRDRLLRWLTNYYNAQHVMDRVRDEKTAHVKREVAAGANPVLSSHVVSDEAVPSNQVHGQEVEPEVASKCLNSDDRVLDWNAQYYQLQSDPSTADPFVRGLRVAGLVSRFRQAAERVVRVIIEELSLPDEAKSVRPQLSTDSDEFLATDELGGLSTCYHQDGMWIYVATLQGQVSMMDDPPSEIDATRDQLELARCWKHQVNAARALRCAIEATQRDEQSAEGAEQAPSPRAYRLCVPLQCTVDYLGRRYFVVASKATQTEPTRSQSSLSGLKSAKEAVKGDLQHAFDRLGLLSEAPPSDPAHSGSSDTFTLPAFFPSDARFSIEIDNDDVPVITLHNLGNLFPPLMVDGDLTAPPHTSQGLLRGEFVHQHGSYIPLSSNAFQSTPSPPSSVVDSKPSRDVNLLQISLQSASEHLVEVVVPSFVTDLEASSPTVTHSHDLSDALHASGVNVQLLGKCYTLATQPDTKRLFMAEILARAAKVELGISLRAIVDEFSSVSSPVLLSVSTNTVNITQPQPVELADDRLAVVRETVVELLNLVLGAASHPDAREFWENRLLPRVRDKFSLHGDHPMLVFESVVSGEAVYFPQLFHAVQKQTNIVLCDHMEYDFRSPLPVSELDLSSFEPKSSGLTNSTAECEEIVAATDELIACGHLDTALDNVKFQLAILHSSQEHRSCQPLTLSHFLSCAADLSLRLNRLEDAREYATLAIEVAPRNHAVAACGHRVAMMLDGLAGDVESAERHFEAATSAVKWHLGPSSSVLTDIFLAMIDVCSSAGDLERAERVLADCSMVTRQGQGKWSLQYADVCRRQATLMFNRWQSTSAPSSEEVSVVLHDAIAIYERHLRGLPSNSDGVSIKLFAASCYYLEAEMASGVDALDGGEAQQAFTMALKALKLRKEALSTSHSDILASNIQLGMLAGRIGEPFRAMEYYRHALAVLKQGGDGDATQEDDILSHSVGRIRDVSRAMLQLFLGSLSSEQHDTVDKTKWRFAALLDRLRAGSRSNDADNLEDEALSTVVRNLFLHDPVEYVAWLIDGTEHETTATLHSQPSSTQSVGSVLHESQDQPAIQTLGGDVSFGAQLAVVLFLTESESETDTAV